MKYDFTDENCIRFYIRRNPKGYGYEIMKIEDRKYTCVYRISDKNDAIYQFETLKNYEGNSEDFKFPESKVEPNYLKALKIESKHYTHYISVPTLEIYYKALREYIIDEYGRYIDNYKPQHEPENKTGITCKEDINKIPFDDVRIEISAKWDNYQKELKDFKHQMMNWQNVKDVINGGGYVEEAMEYMGENYELINLETVE